MDQVEHRTRVAVVSDIRLHGEDLRELLAAAAFTACAVIWAAMNSSVDELVAFRPDVIIVDIAGDIAVGVVQTLATGLPTARILVVGLPPDNGTIMQYVEAGAAGYLDRGASLDDLTQAISMCAADEPLLPASLTSAIGRRLASMSSLSSRKDVPLLTPREEDVAELLTKGFSNKEIAAHLNVEVSTVKNHVHQILRKLNVSRRGAAAHLLRDHFRDR